MSKQIAARIEKIQNTFGKMSIRDQIRQVEGGPDTPIHKAAYEGQAHTLKVISKDRFFLRGQPGV